MSLIYFTMIPDNCRIFLCEASQISENIKSLDRFKLHGISFNSCDELPCEHCEDDQNDPW